MMGGSIDRFSELARLALVQAQEEAQRLGETAIAPEHVVAGVLAEGTDAGAVLAGLGLDPALVREAVLGSQAPTAPMPAGPGALGLTPEAKKMIELAVDEARRLGHHHYIGTAHLLLGAMRLEDSITHCIASFGVTLEEMRSAVQAFPSLEAAPSERTRTRRRSSTAPAGPRALPQPARPRIEYLIAHARLTDDGVQIVSLEQSAPGDHRRAVGGDGGVDLPTVLGLLARDGWALAAIDPTGYASAGPLYIFTRHVRRPGGR
jgi:ATP-dependent Clp protease ATP-binding subunit ClpC